MARYRVRKFNQDHGTDGRFTGPGGSHDPTGNPRGRPKTTGDATPLWKPIARGVITAGTEALLAHGGAVAGGAAGMALGGPIGAALGSAGGRYAASILGSLAGDYVGTKVGNTLLGIKERMDGHGAGEGGDLKTALITGAGGWGAYGAATLGSRFLPGGSVVRNLFSPLNTGLGAEFAQHTAGGLGDIAGSVAAHGAAGAAGKAKQYAAEDITRRAGEYATARAEAKGGKGKVKKDLFGQAPAGYDGSLSALAPKALPLLFGPKAWDRIKGEPFGNYVRGKVKEYAEKMDDAAAQQGIDMTPAKPEEVEQAHGMLDQRDAQAAQQQQAAQDQEAKYQHQERQAGIEAMRQKGKPKPAAKKKPVKKAFSFIPGKGTRPGPSDVVYQDAQQTGGAANVKFMRMMQESERKSRLLQLTRVYAQPGVANLAARPSEDELQYRKRIQTLMRESVRNTDKLRPQLFGAANSVYQVRMKKRKGGDPASPSPLGEGDEGFSITAEFAKGFNSDDKLEQGLVYGWASVIEKNGEVVTDHQGDRITSDELMKAAHDFVSNSRQGGVLHDQFGKEIGHIVESLVFTKQLQDHLGIDLGKVGWLIGYQISSPEVKMLVKSGMLKSFSIGGKGRREPLKEAA